MEQEKRTLQKKVTRTFGLHAEGDFRPVVTVDYARYAHMLDDPGLSEGQKREFLQTLWNIVVEFVSLGFGVHPLQQAQTAGGKDEEEPMELALASKDGVYLDHHHITDIVAERLSPAIDIPREGG